MYKTTFNKIIICTDLDGFSFTCINAW